MAEAVFASTRKVQAMLEICRVQLASSQAVADIEATVNATVAAHSLLLKTVVEFAPTVQNAYNKQQLMAATQQVVAGLHGLVQTGSAFTVARLAGRADATELGNAFSKAHRKDVELTTALAIVAADCAGCEVELVDGRLAEWSGGGDDDALAAELLVGGLVEGGLVEDDGMEDASASDGDELGDQQPLLRR